MSVEASNEFTDNVLECPCCSAQLAYRRRIVIKGVRIHDPSREKHEDLAARVASDEGFLTNTFRCPGCNKSFQMVLEVKIREIREVEPSVVCSNNVAAVEAKFTPEEAQLIRQAHDVGIMAAFTEAVREAKRQKRQPPPKDMDRFFLTFLERAELRLLDKRVLNYLISEHQGAKIEYWKTEGIGMVTADQKIVRFVPVSAVDFTSFERQSTLTLKLDGENTRRIESGGILKRTHLGYVPPSGRLFLAALQQTVHRVRTIRDVPLGK